MRILNYITLPNTTSSISTTTNDIDSPSPPIHKTSILSLGSTSATLVNSPKSINTSNSPPSNAHSNHWHQKLIKQNQIKKKKKKHQKKWSANIIAIIISFTLSILLYHGNGFNNLLNWTGLLFSSFINYILPIFFYYKLLLRPIWRKAECLSALNGTIESDAGLSNINTQKWATLTSISNINNPIRAVETLYSKSKESLSRGRISSVFLCGNAAQNWCKQNLNQLPVPKAESARTLGGESARTLGESARKLGLNESVEETVQKRSEHVDRITWYQLQKNVEFEWFDKLYQNNDMKQRYLNDIKQSQIAYKSYTDKILIEYFNCPSKTTANKTNKAFITNQISEDAFVDYNFPYYFPNGLYHFILFSRHDIIHTMGTKQMNRLISNYIEDKQYTDDILSDNDKYEFLYYEERSKYEFFIDHDHDVPLLSEIIDVDIIPNIIHVFINIVDIYKVTLGANGATWADESFLWTESCAIINKKEVEKFGREETKLRKYIADRNKKKTKKICNIINENENETVQIKKKDMGFNSIRDKILIKEFKCKSEVNEANNKLKAIVDETTPRLLWTENLYPYFFQAGVQHNIVWYLDSKLEKNVLDEYIRENIGQHREYIYWENPPHLKSIPDLNHYQVISVDMNEYMTGIKHLNLVHESYEWNVFVNNQNIMEKHQCDIEYGWNERICRRYLQDIEETKNRFNSLIDADLRKYFKCNVKKDKFGKLVIDENMNEIKNYDHDKYVFVNERYHFYLDAGLVQYLLIIWDDKKWNNDTIQQTIKFELEMGKQDVDEAQFVFWERSQKDEKEKQSLNLCYYHVVVNKN